MSFRHYLCLPDAALSGGHGYVDVSRMSLAQRLVEVPLDRAWLPRVLCGSRQRAGAFQLCELRIERCDAVHASLQQPLQVPLTCPVGLCCKAVLGE